MKLSAPAYRLKRAARHLSRADGIPLHLALDRVATQEGFASWSLLAARLAERTPAATIFGRLVRGDLLLVGARPGHGKTLLSLGLAWEAMKAGNRAAFFTLEYAAKEIPERLRMIGADAGRFEALLHLDASDTINADHIARELGDAPPGTLAVIDYLQLLDQRRANPDLMTQVTALRAFAKARGLILVFLSQIDRSYDPASRPCPDLGDVRLPNPLDLTLFDKTCFINDGEVRFRSVG